MKSESYYNGYDDAMNNYLAEHYGQRPHMYRGDMGNKKDYDEGYKAGWDEADRIDAMVG